jgi:Ca-activated chloride channel homolog
VFSFGIGTSVNRFLLTKMAEEGHGDVEFVTAPGEAQAAADRFYERVHSPVLTNIAIDWNGLPVTDVYPKDVRDLFSAKPIIITGRYSGSPAGKITIKGYQGTGDYSRTIPVDFSSADASNAALEKIWARHKVEDLMSQDWNGIQSGNSKYKADIIKVGLEHSLATQYTSFVAVEERTVVSDGKPVKVEVPVELPEGVSPLAVPGGSLQAEYAAKAAPGSGAGFGAGTYRLYAPAAPAQSSGLSVNETVEVTANAPLIEMSQADVATIKRPARDAARKQAEAKMSPEVLTLYRCATARGVSATASTCKTNPAQIKVGVDLTESAADLEQKLARAGLKIISGSGTKQLVGTIAPKQLRQLAQIAEVKSISLSQ